MGKLYTTVPEKDQHGREPHIVHDAAATAGTGNHGFNEHETLQHLKHYLPTQTPLKDFIHHNPLHAFQHLTFYDAIFRASGIFGYQVTLQLSEYRQLYKNGRISPTILDNVITRSKGVGLLDEWKEKMRFRHYNENRQPQIGVLRSNWKTSYKIDLDTLVQPLLFRILCSYLDQGIALWKFPAGTANFLTAIRTLEKNSFTSFFKTTRAKQLLHDENCGIRELLTLIVGKEAYFRQYLFDQQFSHQGWSGMVATVEAQPHSLMDRRGISLHDMIVLELLLEIDALDYQLGNHWQPLGNTVTTKPQELPDDFTLSDLNEVYALWQDAFEWSYYDEVLAGIQLAAKKTPAITTEKSFQALFCIDERECSLRRHVESTDTACETFGTPGFFSVEFFYQPENGKFYDKLCPAPVTPRYLIKEYNVKEQRKRELLYTPFTHTFFAGFLSALTLGFLSAFKLLQHIFRPAMSPAISNAFAHMGKEVDLQIENTNPAHIENNLQVGFTVEEMAVRVEGLLKGIGLVNNFAGLVYVIAHGSSSANNPHHGAHDCGACSGRPGSVNARVFAAMANHAGVRKLLTGKNIVIPAETQFVGGLHDTASDEMVFYDERSLSPLNKQKHQQNCHAFEQALNLNAKERSRRFASIDTKMSLARVRKAIRQRSVSLFEPRPELGHGTNTICVVGSRNLTKGLFLDRRAFMNSYDYRTDPDGKMLTGIMKPLGPVCGGINLEYYFSRVDNHKLGAGTKLPHNVMALIGVSNSSDGDLRPGLPLQMIEVHDPVRLLIIVEHFPEVVLKTIQSVPEMYEWFINEWVHLVAIHPVSGAFSYFSKGAFTEYLPARNQMDTVNDIHALLESAAGMETNQIADATKENLPVYLINR